MKQLSKCLYNANAFQDPEIWNAIENKGNKKQKLLEPSARPLIADGPFLKHFFFLSESLMSEYPFLDFVEGMDEMCDECLLMGVCDVVYGWMDIEWWFFTVFFPFLYFY